MRCFCSEQRKTWVQGVAKCNPFEEVYGRSPSSLTRFIPGGTAIEAIAQNLLTRDEALRQLKFHL